MQNLDRDTLEAALIGFEYHQKEIAAKIQEIRAQLGTASAMPRTAKKKSAGRKAGKKTRHVSAEARERMAAAQKKRWAAARKAKQA